MVLADMDPEWKQKLKCKILKSNLKSKLYVDWQAEERKEAHVAHRGFYSFRLDASHPVDGLLHTGLMPHLSISCSLILYTYRITK